MKCKRLMNPFVISFIQLITTKMVTKNMGTGFGHLISLRDFNPEYNT